MSQRNKDNRTRTVCSPEIEMDLLIGDSGECAPEYGGMVIRVHDPKKFPWEQVFRTLLELNYEIYIDERDGFITIVSKPKID